MIFSLEVIIIFTHKLDGLIQLGAVLQYINQDLNVH